MSKNTDSFKFEFHGTSMSGRLKESEYLRGGLSVELYAADDTTPDIYEPWCMVSVWLPTTPELPPGVFYGKHWSENEGVLNRLVELERIELVPEIQQVATGYVRGIRAYRMKQLGGKPAFTPVMFTVQQKESEVQSTTPVTGRVVRKNENHQ